MNKSLSTNEQGEKNKQAGAELGQAQLSYTLAL